MYTKASFNQASLELAMRVALQEVAEALGLELHISNVKATTTGVGLWASISNPADQVKEFRALAPSYGLSPEVYGLSFVIKGRTYTIKDIAPSRSRHPVIAERDDGKRFKFSVPTIKGMLAAPGARTPQPTKRKPTGGFGKGAAR